MARRKAAEAQPEVADEVAELTAIVEALTGQVEALAKSNREAWAIIEVATRRVARIDHQVQSLVTGGAVDDPVDNEAPDV